MEAITSEPPIIVCDDCDFEVQAEIEDYLNKSCPKCGAKDIITENDIFLHNQMLTIVNIVNESIGEVPDNSFTKCFSTKITNGVIQYMEIEDE